MLYIIINKPYLNIINKPYLNIINKRYLIIIKVNLIKLNWCYKKY